MKAVYFFLFDFTKEPLQTIRGHLADDIPRFRERGSTTEKTQARRHKTKRVMRKSARGWLPPLLG